jgi:hypothetical protein
MSPKSRPRSTRSGTSGRQVMAGGWASNLTRMGSETSNGSRLRLGSDLQVEGMQQLSQDERSHQLLKHQQRGRSPPQVQPQLAFEQFEGQLDIPAAGVQARDVEHGEQGGIGDVGEVVAQVAALTKLHQAHQVGCAVSAVGAEPNQRIQRLALLVEDVHDAIGGALTQTREPPIALAGEVVEPREAEVAQVGQNEAAWLYWLLSTSIRKHALREGE